MRALPLKLFACDSPVRGVGAVEVHLRPQGRVRELGEALHQLEPRRAGERKHASVPDQEQILLAHVEAKPLGIERAVADSADEWVLVLGLPGVGGRLP